MLFQEGAFLETPLEPICTCIFFSGRKKYKYKLLNINFPQSLTEILKCLINYASIRIKIASYFQVLLKSRTMKQYFYNMEREEENIKELKAKKRKTNKTLNPELHVIGSCRSHLHHAYIMNKMSNSEGECLDDSSMIFFRMNGAR